MTREDIKSFETICRIAELHIKRQEYDLAKPYHIHIINFYVNNPDDCKMLDEIHRRISREVFRSTFK